MKESKGKRGAAIRQAGNPVYPIDRVGIRLSCLFQAWIFLGAGLTTAPERIQVVQTRIFLLLPGETATFTFCKFGSQRLLLLLWAWLTLFPVTGPLPHISHFLAIFKTPLFFLRKKGDIQRPHGDGKYFPESFTAFSGSILNLDHNLKFHYIAKNKNRRLP